MTVAMMVVVMMAVAIAIITTKSSYSNLVNQPIERRSNHERYEQRSRLRTLAFGNH